MGNLKQKNSIIIMSITFLLVIFITFIGFLLKTELSKFNVDYIIYIVLLFVAFLTINLICVKYINRYFKNKRKIMISFVCIILFIAFSYSVVIANFKSGDYTNYLNVWCTNYAEKSLKDALYSIIDVSNYTPAYNYFLILFTRLNINYLYGIKFTTFLFSILLAYVLTKTISLINKKQFNPLIFCLILVFPPILIEFTAYSQCDAIYTTFAMLAFYFALKKKSKLSFLFLGLSFAFKLQFLFIVPIMFILLIIKDKSAKENNRYLKWKDIWIAPLMYVVNLLPALAGRPIMDLLLVYLNQSVYDTRISGTCANICYFYQKFGVTADSPIYNFLVISHFAITIAILTALIVFVIKYYQKHGLTLKDLVFLGFAFSFIMVFFMPKMLDRFYFISMAFSIILLFIEMSNINIYLFTLSNFAMTVSFLEFLLHFSSYITLFCSVLNIITFVLIVLKAKKIYKIK